jgi:hypothetical protein
LGCWESTFCADARNGHNRVEKAKAKERKRRFDESMIHNPPA